MPETYTSNDRWATVAHRLTAEDVRSALNELAAEQKLAIELAYFEGLTCQEIAQRTSAPLEIVKGRLRSGLHSLHTVFGTSAVEG